MLWDRWQGDIDDDSCTLVRLTASLGVSAATSMFKFMRNMCNKTHIYRHLFTYAYNVFIVLFTLCTVCTDLLSKEIILKQKSPGSLSLVIKDLQLDFIFHKTSAMQGYMLHYVVCVLLYFSVILYF